MTMVYLLQHLLRESAERYPHKEAIIFGDERATYAELETRSSALARGLFRSGVERGDRVGIHLNRSIDSITAAFAVLKAGATYVPIDPFCPPSRLDYMVQKCGIRSLLVSSDKLANIGQALSGGSLLEKVLVMSGPDPAVRTCGPAAVIGREELLEEGGGAQTRPTSCSRPVPRAIPRGSCSPTGTR
jgi:acyl-CoA synthetase (AMP-forming)/AMP-acid ligase II